MVSIITSKGSSTETTLRFMYGVKLTKLLLAVHLLLVLPIKLKAVDLRKPPLTHQTPKPLFLFWSRFFFWSFRPFRRGPTAACCTTVYLECRSAETEGLFNGVYNTHPCACLSSCSPLQAGGERGVTKGLARI